MIAICSSFSLILSSYNKSSLFIISIFFILLYFFSSSTLFKFIFEYRIEFLALSIIDLFCLVILYVILSNSCFNCDSVDSIILICRKFDILSLLFGNEKFLNSTISLFVSKNSFPLISRVWLISSFNDFESPFEPILVRKMRSSLLLLLIKFKLSLILSNALIKSPLIKLFFNLEFYI